MPKRVTLILAIALLCCVVAFAQNPITADSPFQVKIFGNFGLGDAYINMMNTGASSTVAFPTQNGNICINVYAYDAADEQLVACCTCRLTPDEAAALAVNASILSNTLTPAHPTYATVKLYATSGSCNAATPGPAVVGLAAWGTNVHAGTGNVPNTMTETPFTPATLSAAELTRATTLCGFIQGNGSGYGICPGCYRTYLGGAQK